MTSFSFPLRSRSHRPHPAHRLAGGVLLATAVVALAGCAPSQGAGVGQPTGGAVTTCSYPVGQKPAKPVDPPDGKEVAKEGTATATMELSAGTVTMTMNRATAPCAVHSFESLAAQQYFDNTNCHRLVDTGIFVLQCGDPTGTGTGGPGYTFADELSGKETYPKGTVAMANAGPDTNGSQFFLVWDDSPLPAKYTVLGTIDQKSLGVVTKIASQGVDAGDQTSPIADANIKKVVMG